MPSGLSLLDDKKSSIEVMRQLLSEVDLETISSGRIADHLDDLLWDGLKVRLLL